MFAEIWADRVGGAGFGDEGHGGLCVKADLAADGPYFRRHHGSVLAPWVDPEQAVRALGPADDLALVEQLHGGGEFHLRLVEQAGGIAVEDLGVALLEGRDAGLAGLPGGGGAEEDAVPVHVGERLAVVVPERVELAGGAVFLAVAGELLDVFEHHGLVGIDLAVVVDRRRNPRFDTGVDVRLQDVGKAVRRRRVAPRHRDSLILEALRQGLQQGRGALRDVAPEEDFAVQRGQRLDDLLQEIEVNDGQGAGVDIGLGGADAEVGGFVGADVEEGAGVVLRELGEPLLDERDGAGRGGGEDGAVRGFGDGLVLLPNQRVAEVAEGFLLGHDGDVELGGVGGKLLRVGRRDAAAGRCRGAGKRRIVVCFQSTASRR